MRSHHPNWDRVGENNKIKLALIDPRSLTRVSLSHLLETNAPANRRSEDFTVLLFSSPDELVSHDSGHDGPVDLIVLSIGAVDCTSEDWVREDIDLLKLRLPDIPLVILSDREEPCNILKVLGCGVRGYIPTRLDPPLVIQALRLVQAGGIFIPAGALLQLQGAQHSIEERDQDSLHPAALGKLTLRQLEVFRLVRQGKSNKVIAYELKMQESTVKVHVRHIMKKLKASNRTHAAFLVSQITAGDLMSRN